MIPTLSQLCVLSCLASWIIGSNNNAISSSSRSSRLRTSLVCSYFPEKSWSLRRSRRVIQGLMRSFYAGLQDRSPGLDFSTLRFGILHRWESRGIYYSNSDTFDRRSACQRNQKSEGIGTSLGTCATLGQLGRGGGAYSAAKIPFNERFRLTATMAEGELGFGIKGCILFSLSRGIEDCGPIQLPSSGLSLPAEARLKGPMRRGVKIESRAESRKNGLL